jgi:hypothetical protein
VEVEGLPLAELLNDWLGLLEGVPIVTSDLF